MIIDKSFNDKKGEETRFDSWLVIAFDYGKADISDIVKYQTELENIVNSPGLGDVDGHEVASDLSEGAYWIACKNPMQVYNLIRDSLSKTTLVKIKEVKKRDKNEEHYSTIFKLREEEMNENGVNENGVSPH